MSSAQQRRETVQQFHVRGVSLRRRCARCHISRSSLRYQPRPRTQNQELATRLHAIARQHPRYGYRRAHALVYRATPKHFTVIDRLVHAARNPRAAALLATLRVLSTAS